MQVKLLILIVLVFTFVVTGAAQGGKAEPLRISFAKGRSSAVRTGYLKSGEVNEFIFDARAGQKVTVKIISTTPKGRFHYFSLLGDGFDFATETDINHDYNFIAPETGDYLLDVNFNPTTRVTAGKFSLTLSITR